MAKRPPKLSFADAVKVWLMRWTGLYQHDIAAHFGVNQGRISEILNGKRWPDSRETALRIGH